MLVTEVRKNWKIKERNNFLSAIFAVITLFRIDIDRVVAVNIINVMASIVKSTTGELAHFA